VDDVRVVHAPDIDLVPQLGEARGARARRAAGRELDDLGREPPPVPAAVRARSLSDADRARLRFASGRFRTSATVPIAPSPRCEIVS